MRHVQEHMGLPLQIPPARYHIAVWRLPEIPEIRRCIASDRLYLVVVRQYATVGELFILPEKVLSRVID